MRCEQRGVIPSLWESWRARGMSILHKEFFDEMEKGIWYYSECHDAPFRVTYENRILTLKCADCGHLKARIAIQEPLKEPNFPHEATFRYHDGKLHFLLLPCKVRESKQNEEWWDKPSRQKYRRVFLPRKKASISDVMS
jgi:hypothetical protein